ncbi:FtsX-like permease family protein [Jonesiaceae bacterium BS-20]|uniref:FtsX-like permease family protein n=1 Tax=Jonesiaceae bacterium BS-20 TaxID=3120821 RepID=A0AAU7DSD2_9MICO
MNKLKVMGKESIAGARSQPVTSALLVLIAIISCALIQLTTGRTAGVEVSLLRSFDEASSRMIVVRAEPDSGLTMDILQPLQQIQELESVMIFGPAWDARNHALGPSSMAVAVRNFPAELCPENITCVRADQISSGLLATGQAMELLGVSPGIGNLAAADGNIYGVSEQLHLPEHLKILEPAILQPIPSTALATQPVTTVFLLAREPEQLSALSAHLIELIDVPDKSKIGLETGKSQAELRASISSQVSSYGHGLLVALLLGTGATIGAIALGVVLLRRREFGRRRSLGATRTWLVTFVTTQVLVLVGAGALIGTATGLAILKVEGAPLPTPSFVVAVLVLSIGASAIFALLPATYAASRDPVAELRVP